MIKKAPVNTVYLNSILLDANFKGEVRYDQLQMGRKLGSGGFKDCYAGKYNGVGFIVADDGMRGVQRRALTHIGLSSLVDPRT